VWWLQGSQAHEGRAGARSPLRTRAASARARRAPGAARGRPFPREAAARPAAAAAAGMGLDKAGMEGILTAVGLGTFLAYHAWLLVGGEAARLGRGGGPL
jgi:hypothetical protein